jgi:hypothetical protein
MRPQFEEQALIAPIGIMMAILGNKWEKYVRKQAGNGT